MANKISFARGVLNGGRVQTVQPRGTKLVDGNHYYNPHTHRALLHITEDEPVVLREPKAASRGGSSAPGLTPYFQRVTRSPKANKVKTPKEIDYSKGYRIHLNTSEFSDAFSELDGVYKVSRNGKLRLADNDLRDREAKSIVTAEDILELMQRADPKRLRDSVVVFRNRSVTWDEFFVRPQQSVGHERFVKLLDRIDQIKQKGGEAFCAMVLRITEPYYYDFDNRAAKGTSLPITRDENFESVTPKVFIDSNNTYVQDAFRKAGDYLVLGIPKVWTANVRGENIHHISIRLENREAVAKIDWVDILKTEPKPKRAAAPVPTPV